MFPKSPYGDGPLWINRDVYGYFDGWRYWRKTATYFSQKAKTRQKGIQMKYKSNEFKRLQHRFSERKRRLDIRMEETEEQINIVAQQLGGTSLETGYRNLEAECQQLMKLLKRRAILRIQSYEAFYGTEITDYRTIEKYINDAQILETLEEKVKIENIIKLALGKDIGKPIADNFAKKELDAAIRKIVKEANGQLIVPPEKGNRKFKINLKDSGIQISINNTNDLINFFFYSNDNYTTKNKIQRTKTFHFEREIDLGTVYELFDNVVYDKSMNDYKRATIYNTIHSNGKGGFFAEYQAMKQSIGETYADRALRMGMPNDNNVLVINGNLINIYEVMYRQRERVDRRFNLETILPVGAERTGHGRHSTSMINRYANEHIRIKMLLRQS